MYLIDTHAHIYLSEFDESREAELLAAKEKGIDKILMPAIDASTHRLMLSLEQKGNAYVSMMGVHPCSIKERFEEELAEAEAWLHKREFIAIGEIGLDFHWDITYKAEQYMAFHRQIGWAEARAIPIVIHSRNATAECIEVIKQYPSLKGVFHCFSGSPEQAAEITSLGFFLGIGGVLTFKNSGLDKAIENISLAHIVLETDAPYLAPVPFRGKQNKPSLLTYIAERLAQLKGVGVDEVAEATTANAIKLFNLS